MEDVTTRLRPEDVELVDRLADVCDEDRGGALRRAIRRGAREELLRTGLERYRDGEVGMRDAAALAGLSIAEAMAAANERGVRTNYDAAELADDVEALR